MANARRHITPADFWENVPLAIQAGKVGGWATRRTACGRGRMRTTTITRRRKLAASVRRRTPTPSALRRKIQRHPRRPAPVLLQPRLKPRLKVTSQKRTKATQKSALSVCAPLAISALAKCRPCTLLKQTATSGGEVVPRRPAQKRGTAFAKRLEIAALMPFRQQASVRARQLGARPHTKR